MELLQIKMLNTAVERLMNQQMAGMGLTYTQSTVIGYLMENREKDICQKDIEYYLGLTHPTVSSVLERMEANGMVYTQAMPGDRRCKKIVLTEKAMELSREISLKYRQAKQKLFAGVAPEEWEQWGRVMQAMLQNTQ